MKPIFYDYSVVKFRLPSRERLVKRLGEYDSLAEFAVLSFRYLEHEAEISKDVSLFIQKKANEYDVKIKGRVSWSNCHESLYKSFMINTYAMFSDFIENIKKDIRILVNPNFSFVDDNEISDYERLKRSLKKIGINPDVPIWLEQLETYYRIIRNHVAHSGNDDEKCLQAYRRIDIASMAKQYGKFKKLAPNPPGKITIYDFYLYSATVKHIANIIVISLKDSIRWSELGKHHPELKEKHPSGTDRRKLALGVLNSYGKRDCTKQDLDKITADIRNIW